MDSYLIFFLDRIYRINKIASRFPDETVKISSAYRRKTENHTLDTTVFLMSSQEY